MRLFKIKKIPRETNHWGIIVVCKTVVTLSFTNPNSWALMIGHPLCSQKGSGFTTVNEGKTEVELDQSPYQTEATLCLLPFN